MYTYVYVYIYIHIYICMYVYTSTWSKHGVQKIERSCLSLSRLLLWLKLSPPAPAVSSDAQPSSLRYDKIEPCPSSPAIGKAWGGEELATDGELSKGSRDQKDQRHVLVSARKPGAKQMQTVN